MRPLDLKISAFGPYAGCVEIPMEKLGDHGLYLITGDTGAGKTTIFDAICFALYGEPSGSGRDAGMFRSKYAAEETPTEVELCFEHAGGRYTVRRRPEYLRPSKRGGGYTRQPADAELHMPDGRVIVKVRDVTTAIEDLLGINRGQFSQIVMLAQGEFLKLLLSDTKERTGIFRRLFQTEYYQKLQESLEGERKRIYGLVEDGRKSIEQYISGIQADKDDVLSIDADKARAGEMATDEVMVLLEKLTDRDLKLKDDTDKILSDSARELEGVNARIGAYESLLKTKEALAEAKRRLEKEAPRLSELKAEYEKARENLKNKGLMEKEATRIEGELPDYDTADKLRSEAENAKNEKETKEKLLKEVIDDRNAKQADLDKKKKEQASLRDTSAELERLNAKAEKIKADLETASELSRMLEDFSVKEKELAEAQEEYRIKDSIFKEKNSRYENDEQLFRDGQAGVLAAALKEGEKCPVCGSLSHPEPAGMKENVPSEKELEEERKNVHRAREERENCAKKAEGIRQVLEVLNKDIRSKGVRFLNVKEESDIGKALSSRLDQLHEENEENKKSIQKCRTETERKQKLDLAVPKLEEKINAAVLMIEQYKTAIAAHTTRLQEKKEQTGRILGRLKYEDKASAEKRIKELIYKAGIIQAEYERADNDLKAQQKLITSLSAEIKSNEETIRAAKVTDAALDIARREELQKIQGECIERGRKIAARLNANENIRTGLMEKAGEVSETEKKLQWVKALADTANGKLAGKEKIMLETYVQMTYFDRIIDRANLRFSKMSSGQYELVRLKEAENTKSQSGLDLGVRDHYNGSERSVRSLSGGESFMASLSLALGLSDEIQSMAGGIQVDTLFVDEGFGSLDPRSLDQAYRALAGLTEGNKLVGIISHVSDLKDRIDRQIVVSKKGGNSSMEIVV